MHLYRKNPLSFNFSPKNYLIKGNLTFTTLMPLILSLSALLLSYSLLTISYNCLTITSYKLVSLILVFPLVPKVVATINGIITGAFSGILFNFINTITW